MANSSKCYFIVPQRYLLIDDTIAVVTDSVAYVVILSVFSVILFVSSIHYVLLHHYLSMSMEGIAHTIHLVCLHLYDIVRSLGGVDVVNPILIRLLMFTCMCCILISVF